MRSSLMHLISPALTSRFSVDVLSPSALAASLGRSTRRRGLPVAAKLARDRIDLGKGARSIVPKGAYVAKYEIVVPRALVQE
jgi:hypothetical protein